MDERRSSQIARALSKLKAKWGLHSDTEVIERLLNEYDLTLLQIIEREDKLNDRNILSKRKRQ